MMSRRLDSREYTHLAPAWDELASDDILGPDTMILNQDTDDEMVCYGYRDNLCKKLLFCCLVVLTAGLLLLVMYWRPDWAVQLKKSRCPLSEADTVLLKGQYGHLQAEQIQNIVTADKILDVHEEPRKKSVSDLENGENVTDDTAALLTNEDWRLKFFDHHHCRYIWDQSTKAFNKLSGLQTGLTCAMLHDRYHGLSYEEQTSGLLIHGPNTIDVKVKSYVKLFFEENYVFRDGFFCFWLIRTAVLVLNPFYIFQICSVVLWSLDNYYIYASCIVLISTISLGVSLYETRKQSKSLRDMVSSEETCIKVARNDGEITTTPTHQLVPGELIIVPPGGCVMTCDAVLMSGNAIVNESMLTGESVPVTKTPLSPSEASEIYSPETHKKNTLFCGTKVIQTRFYGEAKVKAVVVRTGFATAKGQLVRSILFPKPMGFRFYQDAMKFIALLAVIAALGMIYSIVMLLHYKTPLYKVVLRALDIITIVVPPALPAAMTVGTVYAQNRLKKQGIFCISPARINVCGKLKLVCFDKTGTLTEDGLDLCGVVSPQENRFLAAIQNPTELPTRGPFVTAMATCHSLTVIDGELTGDPLDLKMFNAVNWVLEEPGRDTCKFDTLVPTVVKPITRDTYFSDDPDNTPFEVGIIRQFTFSSGLQRMSVITRTLSASHMDIYCKGAPEKIAALCKPNTVPEDFHDVLQKYTMRGYRVIAVGWKPLDHKLTWHQAQRIRRDAVECDLLFLGLLIMENTLKPQSAPVIQKLHDAEIRTVMVTGDNMLTAVSVARQCNMINAKERVILTEAYPPQDSLPARIVWSLADVSPMEDDEPEQDKTEEEEELTRGSVCSADNTEGEELLSGLYQSVVVKTDNDKYHFAITGKSFAVLRQYFPDLLPKICVRATVFARMSPEQKSQLVEELQALGYCVGMCGDGANDCGALKTAHAGISLSEAEASVASPFTSKKANIECVPTVIREGRAALVTSFGVFKYMALYSIVQFVSVLILYTSRTNLGDWMFLYIDLIITTTVAVLMGYTGAYPRLVAKRPTSSLVAPSSVASLVFHITIVVFFQVGVYFYLTMQQWYERPRPPFKEHVDVWTTTVIFYISSYQYLILAFCFSKGPPYRKPIWTNVMFLIALVVLTASTTLLILYPHRWFVKVLQLKPVPAKFYVFRLTLIGIALVNFLLAVLVESFVVPSRIITKLANRLRRKKQPKNKYRIIEEELMEDTQWPPVGEITFTVHTPNAELVDVAYITTDES